MATNSSQYKSGIDLSPRSITVWRIIQTLVWLLGFVIFLSLIFYPKLGILLFWNILIPIAPALFVVSTGLWRNVCPLASTVLLPRHFNLSRKRILSAKAQAQLQLVAVIILYTIIPLRHAVFNSSGPATAMLLGATAIAGTTMGFIYDWKSGWCATLCPVSPVEKLYGGNTLISLPNAHCGQCVKCALPCPDSTHNFNPTIGPHTIYNKISSTLIIGGFPGFIWGWFHVPDNVGIVDLQLFTGVYKMPLIGLSVTLVLYRILTAVLNKKDKRLLVSTFAAAAVSCYYWYRIPALIGFGQFADDGLLISLKNVLPAWSITVIVSATSAFFFWWLILRNPNHKNWLIRPKYAVGKR